MIRAILEGGLQETQADDWPWTVRVGLDGGPDRVVSEAFLVQGPDDVERLLGSSVPMLTLMSLVFRWYLSRGFRQKMEQFSDVKRLGPECQVDESIASRCSPSSGVKEWR